MLIKNIHLDIIYLTKETLKIKTFNDFGDKNKKYTMQTLNCIVSNYIMGVRFLKKAKMKNRLTWFSIKYKAELEIEEENEESVCTLLMFSWNDEDSFKI